LNSRKLLTRNTIVLLLIGVLLFSFTPVHAQETGPVYVVQPGDTLYSIARRFGTTVEAILQINSISDASRIFAGTELTIPGFPGVTGVLGFKQVAFGESLEGLALQYAVTSEDLARLNRLLKRDGFYAGQSIIVPESEDGETPQGTGSIKIFQRDRSRLETAVVDDTNPWSFTTVDGELTSAWVLPGKLFVDPTSEHESITFLDPLESVTIDPVPLIQGQTTTIHVETSKPLTLEGELGDFELGFFPVNENEQVALQGIHAMAETGLRMFSLNLSDPANGDPLYAFQQPILLESGEYGSTVLNGVPPETIDPKVIEPEEALIAEVLAPKTPVKHWDGPFEYPSRYYTDEFIAYFGTRRSYNNGSYLYYHTGVDFYGNGVPVYASAPGYVVFASSLTVRGNVTYIDHGWGVYSGYLHQSEIYVEIGDFVEAGQVIGEVGNTGRVTGPHLHWEIWVGGVPVEPLTWIDRSFP
jgi:murein DD-endopeptidase MepM/ murein hydrolase activator NlpD